MANNHSRPVEMDYPPTSIGRFVCNQKHVNELPTRLETLKKHLPFSSGEGLDELKKIARRFEEKMFPEATTHSDYLRKISLKILTMETKRLTSESS